LLLRREIAVARGFEKHIQLPVLAKLMLAEYYKDDLYHSLEALVFNHPTGAPEELATLEAEAKQTDAPDAAKKDVGTTRTRPKETEWKKDQWAQNWAALEPQLAGENLRPYFFISRDKKVFFPGLELPSRLAATVEMLMGNTPALMRPAAKKLDPKDATQVAAELRNRILGEGTFDAEPKGAAGLAVLAEVHTSTRNPYLALLKSLDAEKLGAWAGNPLGKLMEYPETADEAKALAEDWKKKNKRLSAFLSATTKEKK
jgi:hypothetical protein